MWKCTLYCTLYFTLYCTLYCTLNCTQFSARCLSTTMKTSSYFYKVTSPSTSMQALKSTSLPSLPSSTSMFGSTPTTCRLWITMANVNLTGNILSVLLTAHTKRFSDSRLRDFHLFELLVKGCIENFGLTMV